MEEQGDHNVDDSDNSSDFDSDQGVEFEIYQNDIIRIDDAQTNDELNVPAMPSDTSDPSEQTFDPTLPMQHSYLGPDLTVLHGRTFLDDDEGSSYWIPLLPQTDVVLVPGQTLPLSVFHPPTIQMIHRALEGNRIFGTVCMISDPFADATYADVGTTAEIYEVLEGGINHSMRMKAIGRQRFKLLETKQDAEGFPRARVKILPEIILPHPMAEISCGGLDRYRTKGKDKAEAAKKMHTLRSRDSVMAVWPSWVYTQYDSEDLVKKMLGVLSCHNAGSQIPIDPVELSFWVARSLPIKDSTRLILLRMNSAVQRLRWELFTLTKISRLCCQNCNQTIAHQQDVFSMSAEGLQGAYCNPYGYVYETITIHKTMGLRLENAPPSTEFSWFPGYAWTVASCNRCLKHMGWLFNATTPETKPQAFWGLCRRSLTATIEEE